MTAPREKPVIVRFDGNCLGAEIGPSDVIVALPLEVSHRERLAAIREFGGPPTEGTIPGANIEPELSLDDVAAWMATKGLGARAIQLGGKRLKERRLPQHLRDREPKPQPPTKEVEVYDEETGQREMQTVPLSLGERVVAYAKDAGTRITDKERYAAIKDLKRDSEYHKTNRRRY